MSLNLSEQIEKPVQHKHLPPKIALGVPPRKCIGLWADCWYDLEDVSSEDYCWYWNCTMEYLYKKIKVSLGRINLFNRGLIKRLQEVGDSLEGNYFSAYLEFYNKLLFSSEIRKNLKTAPKAIVSQPHFTIDLTTYFLGIDLWDNAFLLPKGGERLAFWFGFGDGRSVRVKEYGLPKRSGKKPYFTWSDYRFMLSKYCAYFEFLYSFIYDQNSKSGAFIQFELNQDIFNLVKEKIEVELSLIETNEEMVNFLEKIKAFSLMVCLSSNAQEMDFEPTTFHKAKIQYLKKMMEATESESFGSEKKKFPSLMEPLTWHLLDFLRGVLNFYPDREISSLKAFIQMSLNTYEEMYSKKRSQISFEEIFKLESGFLFKEK
jgi:hypothetical protein